MADVVVITPTRDRPDCFALAERWMARQKHASFAWVVVDDGDEPVETTLGQIHVRRQPSRSSCTLPENVLAGLAEAERLGARFLLFVEDDDWYSPRYVFEMVRELRRAGMAGETRRKYYHLPTRGVHHCYNWKHAALASTGVREDCFRAVRKACERAIREGTPYVDMFLWGVGDRIEPRAKRVADIQAGRGKKLFPCRTLSVGLKGMPGRYGLGAGHGDSSYEEFDRDGKILRRWCGDDEAEAILRLRPIPYFPSNRQLPAPGGM